MRDPAGLMRQMGGQSFLAFQILIGGMILSALSHPMTLAFIVTSAWMLAQGQVMGTGRFLSATLMVIDGLNLIGSYVVLIQLGRKAMPRRERQLLGWKWLGVPVYCLLTSLAAWAALIELYRAPFSWTRRSTVPSRAPDQQRKRGFYRRRLTAAAL